MDVSQLSDSELREALVAAGAKVGPITATTRRLFENKLKRLQNPLAEEGDVAPAASPPATTPVDPASTPDTLQAGPELPTSDPPPEPISYFGVALPANLSPSNGEDFVFGNRKDALKAAKDHPGARFKEFATKEEALKFSSQPACVANPQTPQSKPIPGESSEFRGPKTPELSKFRGYIEKGQLEVVREHVWSNPRYLISGGDAPVILQEGCRYNALHVCALKNQAAMATLILETLEDEAFMAKLYPQDSPSARTDRINHMLDLYLNMPNKGNCETPLHFACKFGNVDVVRVLLAHPLTNRLLPNDRGETPEQITCTRVPNKSPGTKKNILKLIQATCFVPLMRPADKCGVAVVGEPRPAVETIGQLGRSPSASPYHSPLVMDACAGPMSPSQAQDFRKKWMAHTSMEQRKQFLSICCKDDEKGQERIGRILAQSEGVGWREYWEFLESYVDLSTPTGLGLLEDYLEQRTHEEAGHNIISSNTTICAEMEVESTLGEGDAAHQAEDSFTEKLGALDEQFASLTLRSPTGPVHVYGNKTCNALEDINPWRDKCFKTEIEQGVDGNHNTESHSPHNTAIPGGVTIEELHSAVQDLALERAVGSPPTLTRQKSDLESEGSDFISCVSEESDQSFETYYTAADSPPLCITPPGTPNHVEQPVFLIGPEPTKVDSDVLHALDESVITPEFPNVTRWHKYVTAYSEEIRNKWSSPRHSGSWSTSQRHGAQSRLGLHSPWNTPVRGLPLTPSHTPGRTPVKLQAVRTNLMTALSDTDPNPATT